ncbi:MAG: cupin domain-containing protein [Candidatus Omnitrophota bacterium]
MFIRKLYECPKFVAGDDSSLRELLHGKKDNLQLRYSLARAVVKPKTSTKPHKLKFSEVYYILEGEGLIFINRESSSVYPGDAIYIPPGAEQYIENKGEGDLAFLCIVDPAWCPECEEIIPDEKR